MKKMIVVMSVLSLLGATQGCGGRRHTTTTSTTETIQSVPADPVSVEKSSTRTETRTSY